MDLIKRDKNVKKACKVGIDCIKILKFSTLQIKEVLLTCVHIY